MNSKNAVGRPLKVNYKIMMKLADAVQHSASISDACRYAGISRDTYYRYLNSEPVFREKMETARADQYKLKNFLTVIDNLPRF